VWVELYVLVLLVVGAGNIDSGGESDFGRGVHGGYHGICVWVGRRYEEVGKL